MGIWLSYGYRFLLCLYLREIPLPLSTGAPSHSSFPGDSQQQTGGDQPQTGKPEQRLKQHRLSGCILSMCSDLKGNISAVTVFQIKKLC